MLSTKSAPMAHAAKLPSVDHRQHQVVAALAGVQVEQQRAALQMAPAQKALVKL